MKKMLYGFMTVIFCAAVLASSAQAGSKQRHRWEGAAIGLGAAIIGGAVLNSMNQQQNYRSVPEPVYSPHIRQGKSCYSPSPPPAYHNRRPYPSPPPRHSGYWEVRKYWTPPVVERVWNPAHYNRRNEWVPGQWIEIEKAPGFWSEERIWVADR